MQGINIHEIFNFFSTFATLALETLGDSVFFLQRQKHEKEKIYFKIIVLENLENIPFARYFKQKYLEGREIFLTRFEQIFCQKSTHSLR